MAAEDRERAEQEFMKIAAAYEVLSDDEVRAKYDRGEDVSGNRGAGGPPGHNPHQHFQHGGQHFNFHFRH